MEGMLLRLFVEVGTEEQGTVGDLLLQSLSAATPLCTAWDENARSQRCFSLNYPTILHHLKLFPALQEKTPVIQKGLLCKTAHRVC